MSLPDLTSVYEVEIASQSCDREAFMTANPHVLLPPPAKRGNNLVIPRADGTLPLGKKLGEKRGTLQMVFVGDCDPSGTPSATPAKQVLDNLKWFETNVYLATPGADNCLGLVVTSPNSGSWSGRIQLLSFEWEPYDLTTYRALLDFVIPQRLT